MARSSVSPGGTPSQTPSHPTETLGDLCNHRLADISKLQTPRVKPIGGAIDFTQDSDHNNSKLKKVSKKDSEFDDILEYFEPPYHANEGDTGEKSSHRCKWCSGPYKKSKGTNSNLTKHRDGTKERPACSGRSDAIAFGAKLPLTAMEIEFNKQNHKEDLIHNYAQNTVFEMRVLNQLLVMWLI
ncbi:uncharacterized protein PGTG_20600 [Puccinia graminis f. sp. tritici CRL 75-36-700-3]|uniref:Uncharacterized protein n=1 Tax=Puccinia graminis f. sp. tritici (strain CRL 75-36-700-3 / race SCCL) TaxID=418459 RepID=H6QNV7_PUCGT|nr:uncharacterized protein PGTG_20600 [Puccinia graminis f. sp. tritici CRL 75-36-700-3]EHS62477.1 hypothetical protein PGTG_20600 [Puccinia graminis f. sp. tritici CRL 75-36-700-3]